MKRTIALAAAAASAAVALVASASGQTPPTTLHLVDHEAGFASLDAKPKQLPKKPSLGDTIAIAGRLTGDRTGTDGLTCTFIATSAKAGAELCRGVAHLSDGDLLIEGRSEDAARSDTYVVQGGTGAYAGATGTVVTKSGSGRTTRLTVTLQR